MWRDEEKERRIDEKKEKEVETDDKYDEKKNEKERNEKEAVMGDQSSSLSLSLSHQQILSSFRDFFAANPITSIDVSRNDISIVPPELCYLPFLKEFTATSSKIALFLVCPFAKT